ncbi:hypothetical protein J2S43_001428 [Catenuloplanes nepalensis]|uniref:Uncharacterized protein n=1 Tax=Catenuloplanes nepalensis TaxID=587533 RepID=A0ABT9MNK9_9ACTN|nr:hypothetical protein [Catenuloplanes nepalensis]MDP9792916.1 hypothetical protein [Catenuloplanes nepalensis]
MTSEQVAAFESDAPLPEIYTYGTSTMYQAVYGDDGVLDHVRRTARPPRSSHVSLVRRGSRAPTAVLCAHD